MSRSLPSGLGRALDASLVREPLAERARALLGSGVRVRRVTGEILRRATVRYTIELDGAPFPSWRVIGKIHASRAEGEAARAALDWLWENDFPARPPVEVTIPRMLGYLPEVELFLMQEAGGLSLQRLLNEGRARAKDLRRFAEVLVKLHRMPCQDVEPFTLDQHLELRCRGLLDPLVRDFPDLAEPTARIVAAAREVEEDLLPAYTLAHGDYHPGQVHVDGERSWLLDLELLQRRDPAYDVAMVVVRLKGMGTRLRTVEAHRQLLSVFLETYFSRMDCSIADRVPLNAALIFLKRACKRFCFQDEPGWPAEVRNQVGQATDCLLDHESLRPGRDLTAVLERCASCPGAT